MLSKRFATYTPPASKRTVMLTGDREEVAASVTKQLSLDEFHAQLLRAIRSSVLRRCSQQNRARASSPL